MSWLLRIVLIGAFGAVGAVSRYLIGQMALRLTPAYPEVGTLAANAVGCFLFGLVFQLAFYGHLISENARLLLLTGFLGALTTFSAYAFDGIQLAQTRGLRAAVVYLLLQNVLGILLAWGGMSLGRAVAGQ